MAETDRRVGGDPAKIVPHRWKPGQSGNPGGKTKLQRKLEVENAERATRVRSIFLQGAEAVINEVLKSAAEGELKLDDGFISEAQGRKILAMLNADILRLMKDAEERGLGAPEKTINVRDADKPDDVLMDELQEIFEGVGVDLDVGRIIGAGEYEDE